MDWRDDVAAELPSPNEDEPASLRRNILDELSDHLASAAERERIHENDEETVQRTILNRFGDPAGIARRLWFDAMKGKFMLQKLTAAFAATAALAAIAVCFVLWSAVNSATSAFELAVEQSRKDRALAAEQSRKDRERADKANAALLAKLEVIAAGAKKNSVVSMEWNPVKFKLLLGPDGERPAVGYEVELSGQPYKRGEDVYIRKRSDANGVVDFGRVHPGIYDVKVTTPWDMKRTMRVHIGAGIDFEKIIRCSETNLVAMQVELAVDLPEDLAKRKCRIVTLIDAPKELVGKKLWEFPYDLKASYHELSPTENARFRDYWRWFSFSKSKPNPNVGFLGWAESWERDPVAPSWGPFAPADGTSERVWYNRTYFISFVALLLPSEQPPFYVIGHTDFAHQEDGEGGWEDRTPRFTPQPGKKNVWKIPLSPKMLARARERLKKYDARTKVAKKKKPGEKSAVATRP